MNVISSAPPAYKRRIYWLLQALAHLLLPVVFFKLLLRSRKEPDHLKGFGERLGFGAKADPNSIWFFAASVGEIRAASPLIKKFREAGQSVLLTYQSPAGKAEGKRLFADDPGVSHRFVAIDLFWAIRLFLRRQRPKLLIVLEIEIWPAMLIESKRAGLPMIMANGNLLNKSIEKRGLLRSHLFALYRLFDSIYTRTDAYKQRYLSIGVEQSRIHVVGDLRFDQQHNGEQIEVGNALRRKWTNISQVLLIASSVEAEEPMLVPLVRDLLTRFPTLGVIWAPRSPQRFDAVASQCANFGFQISRRSNLTNGTIEFDPNTRVVIADSIGEMDIWYHMSDLVFVGASLVAMGGHNIIEPLSHGKPVVMGPSIYGIEFAAREAERIGAFESLPNSDALGARLRSLFLTPEELDKMASCAGSYTENHMGAVSKTFASVSELLEISCQQ